MYMWSTLIQIFPCMLLTNHPHVYGEYTAGLFTGIKGVESSPCIWGVHSNSRDALKRHGIIPMYMGSTVFFGILCIKAENHPHVYGEYTITIFCQFLIEESSPCIWGVPR